MVAGPSNPVPGTIGVSEYVFALVKKLDRGVLIACLVGSHGHPKKAMHLLSSHIYVLLCKLFITPCTPCTGITMKSSSFRYMLNFVHMCFMTLMKPLIRVTISEAGPAGI